MMRLLKVLVLLSLVGLVAAWFISQPRPLDASVLEGTQPGNAERGSVLAKVGGCANCHSVSKGKDPPLAGGYAMPTDFGTFYTPNISPHPTEGIGTWDDLAFLNAMLRGIGSDSSHHFPAFPFTSYNRLAVQDVRDIKAHIDNTAPSATPSKAHDVSFPFNMRRAQGLWKFLFFSAEKPKATSGFSDTASADHGAYLVNALGHCGECHSPRNALGGHAASPGDTKWLSGGMSPEGKKIPSIRYTERGIGSWSEDEIVEALSTGFTPEFEQLGVGGMDKVVAELAQVSDVELRSIALYLLELKDAP